MAVVSWLSNDNEVTKNKIRDDNIAPIELNALSASKTYTVGKSFVLDSDGKLYKATQQIDQGSAIITSGENANCEEVTEKVLDVLGTASTKNSTSVVTESSDLVESGAVFDALGFGNKNLLDSSHGVLRQHTSDPTVLRWGYEPITLKAGTYTISFVKNSNYDLYWCFTDTWQNVDLDPAGTTVTLSTEREVFIRSALQSSSSEADFLSRFSNVQLERGSVATAYEPYHVSVLDILREGEVVDSANLWDEVWEYGSISGTDGTNISDNTYIRSKNYIPVDSENVYKIINGKRTGKAFCIYYNENKTHVGTSAQVVGSNTDFSPNVNTAKYMRFTFLNNGNPYGNDVIFGYANEVTTYEPYYVPLKDSKCDNTVIAPTENGTTASQDYAVGDYFIKNTILGKTKIAIARGGTFTKDMNYEETDVAKEMTELYKYIGILTTPISAVVANNLQPRFKDITSDFYLGTLRAEIAAGDFSNIRVGDYIIGQTTGSKYYVACLDWMFNKGDQTNATYQAQAYGQHHLGLMLFKPVGTTSLWLGKGDAGGSWQVSANDKGRCPWNAATDVDPTSTSAVGSNDTNITRSYNGSNVSGYMGSFIRERMDAILLPQCFQADFGSSNVLMFRNLNGNAVITDKPSGGQGNWNGCTSGWAWYDRYLDLPSEVEIYGSRIFGSAYDIGVQCERLPMFKNADINAYFPRLDLWTKAVASSSYAAARGSNGDAGRGNASFAIWACPLACVR